MSIAEIKALLQEHQSFIFTTHLGADGDGFGAELALSRYLRSLGKTVRVINPDPFDPRLGFLLQDGETIETFDPVETAAALDAADAILLLDVNTWSRLGTMGECVRACSTAKICIDHHKMGTETFEASWIEEDACATGQMIFDLLEDAGSELTKELAEPLYVSLLTDTGSFRFARTSPRVHHIAGRMIDVGVKPHEVYENLYEQQALHQVQLTGDILATMDTAVSGRLVWLKVTQDMLARRNASMDDTGDVVTYTIALAGVEVGILFKELTPGVTKASLRSKGNLDVNDFARTFGGGGHRHAAGIVFEDPFDVACAKLIDAVSAALEALPPR